MIEKEYRPSSPGYQTQFYIDDRNGDDTANDGTSTRPFKTIAKALTVCGSAANSTDFHNDLINRRTFYVAPGQYTETLNLPMWKQVTFVLDAAQIVGNITHSYSASSYQIPGNQQVKVTFKADSLRSAFDNAGVAQIGIQGNFTFNPQGGVSPTIHVLELINCGIVGNIVCSAQISGYFAQILASDAYIIGDVIANSSPSGIAAALVYNNCDYQASRSAGGTSGNVALFNLRNVKFTRPVVTNSTTGGRWFNVQFNGSLAHNFTGFGGTIETDSVSYASYLANVPTKGGGTFTLLDNANAVRYTPTTSANWPTVPTTVLAALDSLVAKDVRTINTTAVANSGITETNLIQFTLAASTLATNGNTVTQICFGRFAANGNNKRVRAYLGATVIYDTGSIPINGGSWQLTLEIIRTGATAQKIIASFLATDYLMAPAVTYTLGAENLANSLVIKCTGQGGSTNDIIQEVARTTVVRA